MPSRTKQDWFNAGSESARTGIAQEPPKAGTWQRRAYDDGYAACAASQAAVGVPGPRARPFVHIDVAALLTLAQNWPAARLEHIRVLAADYNQEGVGTRRLRLYKRIGRLFERHGLNTTPIPTV